MHLSNHIAVESAGRALSFLSLVGFTLLYTAQCGRHEQVTHESEAKEQH